MKSAYLNTMAVGTVTLMRAPACSMTVASFWRVAVSDSDACSPWIFSVAGSANKTPVTSLSVVELTSNRGSLSVVVM